MTFSIYIKNEHEMFNTSAAYSQIGLGGYNKEAFNGSEPQVLLRSLYNSHWAVLINNVNYNREEIKLMSQRRNA